MNVINQIQAVKSLRDGHPLVFQTDTLPAIGCKPEYSDIIYSIKKRSKDKALILMGSEISQVLCYVHIFAKNDFKSIAEKYWPGPLTLVVPISDKYRHLKFLNDKKTIGIRIPNSPRAKSLISKTGPLATSSANISGITTSFTADQVSNDLPNVEILGPVPWEECSCMASTIISWEQNNKWVVIRKGQIKIPNI